MTGRCIKSDLRDPKLCLCWFLLVRVRATAYEATLQIQSLKDRNQSSFCHNVPLSNLLATAVSHAPPRYIFENIILWHIWLSHQLQFNRSSFLKTDLIQKMTPVAKTWLLWLWLWKMQKDYLLIFRTVVEESVDDRLVTVDRSRLATTWGGRLGSHFVKGTQHSGDFGMTYMDIYMTYMGRSPQICTVYQGVTF